MSGGYAKAPGASIPKRWMTPIRVMCEPVEGYVMALLVSGIRAALTFLVPLDLDKPARQQVEGER